MDASALVKLFIPEAESDALKSFHTAGFLGSEYGPFGITDPDDASASVRPPAYISGSRFADRYQAYRDFVAASPVMQTGSDYQRESLLRSVEISRIVCRNRSCRAMGWAAIMRPASTSLAAA